VSAPIKAVNETDSASGAVLVDPCAKAPCGLSADFLSTGDLARACETTLRTVRFYEETGLVEPSTRSEGGHRMYDPAQREKLQLIMDLREAGLSIQDIKDLFALKGRCGSAHEASATMTTTLEARINEMQRKIVVLRRLRDELASMVSVVKECGSCDHKQSFVKECGSCDVMEREDLPRAMRLLWGK
jgi:MerR family Zn(II)-responsive transcriptional regulator of zntA